MIDIKINYKKIYKKVLILTIGIMPLIDSINGFLMKNYSISIALAYRAIALLALLYYTYNKSNVKRTIYISTAILYFVSIALVSALYHNNLKGLTTELSTASKLIFIIAIVESFKNIICNSNDGEVLVEKIIKLNLVLFPLCIIIPMILGVGYDVYHGAGNKGFFNANNELGIVLSVLFIFALDYLYNKISIKNVFIFLIVTFSMISIGSKIGLVAPIIITVIYFIKSIINLNRKIKFTMLIIATSIIVILIVNILFSDMLVVLMERQIWLYTNIVENSLIFLILSGRNIMLSIINANLVQSNNILFKILFGYGIYNKEKIISLGYGAENLKPIEMDFFDAFYSYGIVGVFIIYGYLLHHFVKYKSLSGNGFKYTLSFITIIVLGFFSGHVFWGAMAGSMLGIVMCGMIISKKIEDMKGE